MEVFPGISMDPAIRFGRPCLVGTRVDVATVVGALGAGEPFEAVEEAFGLTRQQVLTALLYSAHVAAHLPPAVAAGCCTLPKTPVHHPAGAHGS